VPALKKDDSGNWVKDKSEDGLVSKYRPRIEGGFARIERVIETTGNVYWKVTSKDNIISIFGKSKNAQIYAPGDETKIFKWLLEFSCDDRGDCFQFDYKTEDIANVSNQLHEKNRLNRFFKTHQCLFETNKVLQQKSLYKKYDKSLGLGKFFEQY